MFGSPVGVCCPPLVLAFPDAGDREVLNRCIVAWLQSLALQPDLSYRDHLGWDLGKVLFWCLASFWFPFEQPSHKRCVCLHR